MELFRALRLAPALAMGATLLLAACGTAPDPGGSTDGDAPDLAGRTFLSTSVTGHELVAGSQISLSFEGEQLSARAGCNSLFGEYAVEQDTLRVTQLGGTEMGCPAELMAQDEWLTGFLQGGPAVVVAGDRLTLSGGGTELVLTDRVVADPDRPLEGTTWQLDTHYGGDTASHDASMEAASLVFDGERLLVSTGCNRGSATYLLEGDEVSVGPLVLTRMACEEPAMNVERLVTGVLDGQVLTVTIEAGQLTLMGADGEGLGLRAVTTAP